VRYENDRRFSTFYLEDSWVLGIYEAPGRLNFELDVVLTPEHPDYVPNHPGEQHCYRRGALAFSNITHITWHERGWDEAGFKPAMDATDQADFGNIDSFEIGPGDKYELEGDWGHVELQAGDVELRLALIPDGI